MKKKNTDHIVLNYETQPPTMECRNCGESMILNLPVGLSMFSVIAKQFIKEHKNHKWRKEYERKT